jgi:aspartyl-tRNA(Asn)/glutamyl-tRNA(Gln) amidotransferase subunit B
MDPINYEPVIGLEIHAELQTETKMFCCCRVVDSTQAIPNISVCPVCMGMPGVLPVTNKRAVEFGIRVALALGCSINTRSIFARKNYFYPDLPKGYQISQYEEPLARNGSVIIKTSLGSSEIRVRRVHLEEDTGKLTHDDGASFIDLNRAGIPLLEIVSEPEIHSGEEARAYSETLRSILMYLGVNSGDMQKGVMRIEPNVSVRPTGTEEFGTRTEIKNLNSYKALERGIAYEIRRQINILEQGGTIQQETVGWDEVRQVTYSQRIKEGEEDYRYFPEPDLPPLVIDPDWVDEIQASLPELPLAKLNRFREQYRINDYTAGVLVVEREIADYFEAAAAAAPGIHPKKIANWITGELFGLMNESGVDINDLKINPESLGELLTIINDGIINNTTAKSILKSMLELGKSATEIIDAQGLRQISNREGIAGVVKALLKENPDQALSYLGGKEGVFNWFFGQIMRQTKGKANPQIVKEELGEQLALLRKNKFP